MRTTIEHDPGDGTPTFSVTIHTPEDDLPTVPQPTGGGDPTVSAIAVRDYHTCAHMKAATTAVREYLYHARGDA